MAELKVVMLVDALVVNLVGMLAEYSVERKVVWMAEMMVASTVETKEPMVLMLAEQKAD